MVRKYIFRCPDSKNASQVVARIRQVQTVIGQYDHQKIILPVHRIAEETKVALMSLVTCQHYLKISLAVSGNHLNKNTYANFFYLPAIVCCFYLKFCFSSACLVGPHDTFHAELRTAFQTNRYVNFIQDATFYLQIPKLELYQPIYSYEDENGNIITTNGLQKHIVSYRIRINNYVDQLAAQVKGGSLALVHDYGPYPKLQVQGDLIVYDKLDVALLEVEGNVYLPAYGTHSILLHERVKGKFKAMDCTLAPNRVSTHRNIMQALLRNRGLSQTWLPDTHIYQVIWKQRTVEQCMLMWSFQLAFSNLSPELLFVIFALL